MDYVFSLLLAFHLLAVNVAGGAPFWVVFCERGYCRNRILAQRSGLYLSIASLGALLVGGVLGILLFVLRWSPAYSDAVGRLSHKLTWGGGELVFSLVLGGLSIWLWNESAEACSAPQWKRWLRGGIALLNSTNLLYHFPLLFLVLRNLADDPGEGAVTAPAFRHLIVQGATPAMSVHVVLASLAMGGITLMGLALRWRRTAQDEEQQQLADRAGLWAGRAALFPTLLQIPVGLWLLISMGTTAQSQLMGADLVASLMFLAGVGAALWLLQNLAMIANGQTDRRSLLLAMGLSTLTVVLMTFAWQLSLS